MDTNALHTPLPKINGQVFIVVVDNGFVYIGRTLMATVEGHPWVVMPNAVNMRQAGTTKGYGEIAFGGPTKSTVLDPTPGVMVPFNRLCHLVECDQSKWEKTFPAI